MDASRKLLNILLSLAFALTSLQGFADDGVQINSGELAAQKAREETEAPSWFQNIRTLRVRAFFTSSIAKGTEPEPQEKRKLFQYLSGVFQYMDQDDRDGEHRNFMRDSIAPFVNGLTREKLLMPIRDGKLTDAIGSWTLENVVVRHMIAAYAGSTDRIARTAEIFKKHSKGITLATGFFIFSVITYYLDSTITGGRFATGLWFGLSFALANATFGTFTQTALESFTSPINQFVKVWSARLFGSSVQSWMGRKLNKFNPKIGSDDDQANANMAPRILDPSRDHANFGGMSEEDQKKNWAELSDDMVKMDAHAPRLMRSSLANGRTYIINAMTDVQNSANAIFNLNANVSIQSMRSAQVLSKYETKFLLQDEFDKIDQLNQLYEKFVEICDETYVTDWTVDGDRLIGAIHRVYDGMRALGVRENDLVKLWEIQIDRGRAIDAMVSATNIAELKRFMNAESNRNAVDRIRDLEAATYQNLHVGDFASKLSKRLKKFREQIKVHSHDEAVVSCNDVLSSADFGPAAFTKNKTTSQQ